MKKILCVFLAFFVFVSICGCKEDKKAKSAQKDVILSTEEELTLLYSKTDGFNPYTAKTQENRDLCALLFDSLINFTADCTYKCQIASSVQVSGNECTVHLNPIDFTDGTPLTAQDVIYSFNLAKSSASSGYQTLLAEIASASAVDSYTVKFTVSFTDLYVANLLTFPIIKSGTANLTDSDGVALPPVGSGKYTVGETNDLLIRNDGYYGVLGPVKTIKLLSAPDAESISHHIEVGSADLYYTDADAGKIVRMSGKRSEVNINRLIYIGVNSTYGALANREMRYALSSAINRSEIVNSAYYGVGTPASSYYNPRLADTKSTASLEDKSNLQITVENLSKLGYNVKDSEGYYINNRGNRASFSLLVNSDNVSRLSAARLIASECKTAGIEITVIEEPFSKYLNRLSSGSFQLYLGEVEIMPNMDMSPLVCVGGSAAYGVTESKTQNSKQLTVSAAVASYKSGALGVADLSGVLLTEMPQIPVCYRNGLLFYSDKIKSGVEGLYKNIYYSIENYKFK